MPSLNFADYLFFFFFFFFFLFASSPVSQSSLSDDNCSLAEVSPPEDPSSPEDELTINPRLEDIAFPNIASKFGAAVGLEDDGGAGTLADSASSFVDFNVTPLVIASSKDDGAAIFLFTLAASSGGGGGGIGARTLAGGCTVYKSGSSRSASYGLF